MSQTNNCKDCNLTGDNCDLVSCDNCNVNQCMDCYSVCKDCDDLLCLECNPSGFCKGCIPFVYKLLKDFDEEGGELYFKYFDPKSLNERINCGLLISVDGDIWYKTEYSGSSYFAMACCGLLEIDEEEDYEPEYYTAWMDKETMIDFLDWVGEDSRV